MNDFDFRDMMGGAGRAVDPNPALADGASANHAHGLCGHLLAKVARMPVVVEQLARAIIWTANANGICTGGLLGLVAARLAQIAYREVGEGDRAHLIAEVEAALLQAREARD